MANIRYINFQKLLSEMENKNRITTSFEFLYNGVMTWVVLQRLVGDIRAKYAKASVSFIREDNEKWVLKGYIDFWDIHFNDVDDACLFFGVSSEKIGNRRRDTIPDISIAFGKYIPEHLQNIYSADRTRISIEDCWHSADGEEGEKLYCYKVARLGTKADGTPKKRSKENSKKTMELRPDLYELFKDDPSLSFYYTADESKGKKLYEIIRRFSHED